jgi:hypothetical protein
MKDVQIFVKSWFDHQRLGVCNYHSDSECLAARLEDFLQHTNMELYRAVKEYFLKYMQDEAEAEYNCTCGPQQHSRAVRVKSALEEFELLTNRRAVPEGPE